MCVFLLPVTNEEEDEHRSDTSGYRAVGFSYGNYECSADQKNTDADMESSRFVPPFPIPENLLHCLPPTEKVHQIIGRTAMFVSKHGGQSDIILRVKQGDNPTFGFLMPGHHLHAYFRFVVEHPDLLHSESDGNSQDDQKKTGTEHSSLNGVSGALSLLGSVYGSGEEEEDDEAEKTEKDVPEDHTSVNSRLSHVSKKIESDADASKDESLPRNPILSNKEKVLTVKKNYSIAASKPVTVKGMEEKSRLCSAAADKVKSLTTGMTSKIDALIVEPPPELKRLIDKLVELVVRNGKQFEATLIEQDSKHGRFPFLLPSNQYHSYYLKVLQTAQESKINGKSFDSGKDLVGHGTDKNDSIPKEKDFSSMASAACDMPPEYDRKERFKMVIGKSKKEAQETEYQGTQQDNGITLDAAAAAAILQAATRGIKISNSKIISSSSPIAHVHVNSNEGGQPGDLGSVLPSQPGSFVEKSGQGESCNASAIASKTIARTVSSEAAGEADSSEAHLTKEQKLKAERLKRANMFVAMLKSGEAPFKTERSRGSSLEPVESGVSRSSGESNLDVKEREGSLAPPAVHRPATYEKPERNCFNEEQRTSKRKYRSRSGQCGGGGGDGDDDDDGDVEYHEHRSNRNFRSKSRRHNDNSEYENASETEERHRRRYRTHSSSEENEDEGESSKEVDACKDKYEVCNSRKWSRRKHHSRRSHEQSVKRRSFKHHSSEEDEHDDHGRDRKHFRKRHRSHRSSHGSRDKYRHRRERESQHKHGHDVSSDNEHKKELHDERELEEGDISSRVVSEESREIASGHISRETSVDVVSSQQRASSQSSEVADDLRAKIRSMLMATHS